MKIVPPNTLLLWLTASNFVPDILSRTNVRRRKSQKPNTSEKVFANFLTSKKCVSRLFQTMWTNFLQEKTLSTSRLLKIFRSTRVPLFEKFDNWNFVQKRICSKNYYFERISATIVRNHVWTDSFCLIRLNYVRSKKFNRAAG